MERILFILNGPVKDNDKVSISGGDVRLIEILKRTKNKIDAHILTTLNGAILLDKFKVNLPKDHRHIIPYTVNSSFISNFLVSFLSIWYSFVLSFQLKPTIVYSSCEHLYDVLPALIFKFRLGKKIRWFAVYHWVEDFPWKNKRGDTPFFRRYIYWLNRLLSGILIKHGADRILAVSHVTKNKLIQMKKISPFKIKTVYAGIDLRTIKNIISKYANEKGKKYDAVYMKRLDWGKGIFDLLRIWKIVVKHNPSRKLAIIGAASKDVLQKIQNFISKHNLQDNITLFGPIYDMERKIRTLYSAKIFVLPSHEENWAIVIGEAMAVGLPVVAYDLKEIKPVWKDNVLWVKEGDIKRFALAIDKFTNNSDLRENYIRKGLAYVAQYDWNQIASDELKYIL